MAEMFTHIVPFARDSEAQARSKRDVKYGGILAKMFPEKESPCNVRPVAIVVEREYRTVSPFLHPRRDQECGNPRAKLDNVYWLPAVEKIQERKQVSEPHGPTCCWH